MSELPEWIQERVEVQPERKLQESAVSSAFVESDRPYMTRRQVQNELDGDFSKATVVDRLNGLCEAGILKSDPEADIYWLQNNSSDWPLPPDVVVEPAPDEITVSEFFDQSYVKYTGAGIGLNLLASLLLWAGAFIGTAELGPLQGAGVFIIAVSMLLMIVGWSGIIYGMFSRIQ